MIDRRSMTKQLAALPIAGLLTAGMAAPKRAVGEPAPDFTLTLLDKTKVSLSELRGRVVVLNFGRPGVRRASASCRCSTAIMVCRRTPG